MNKEGIIYENKRLQFFVSIFSNLTEQQLLDTKLAYEEEGVVLQLKAINNVLKTKFNHYV